MYHGEKFNSVSHLAGAGLAVVGSGFLIALAAHHGDPWKIVSVAIYGAMLIFLYSASVLYHSLRGRAKDIMRKFDHCAIYLLIAGSYTPFALVTLRGPWGWSLFGVEWGLAVIGIVQELWLASGARISSLVIYCLMGWLALIATVPLMAVLGPHGFALLAIGGFIYTVGIVFYALDERIRHFHGIWHLFVLAGSATHFFAILFYVA